METKKFYSAYEAAEYAATLNNEWENETDEIMNADELLSFMSIADEEGEIDEENEKFYYIVTEDGTIGVTSDAEKMITWIAKATKMKSKNDSKETEKEKRQHGKVGYSNIIGTDNFKKAIKKYKKSHSGCAIVFILAPSILASIYSLFSDEIDLIYGAVIGGVITAIFFLIYFIATLKERIKKSWDGVVIEKYEDKVRVIARHASDKNYSWRTHYFTIVRLDNGKKEKIEEQHPVSYSYLKVGDRIRYHGKMGLIYPYEKYDKSNDEYVICSFCENRVPIVDDECSKCHNPILK